MLTAGRNWTKSVLDLSGLCFYFTVISVWILIETKQSPDLLELMFWWELPRWTLRHERVYAESQPPVRRE